LEIILRKIIFLQKLMNSRIIDNIGVKMKEISTKYSGINEENIVGYIV